MVVIEEARAARGINGSNTETVLNISFVGPGSVYTGLKYLRMARKLDRFRSTARMALGPWLVQ